MNKGEQENIVKKSDPGKGLGRGETFWADGDYQNLRARATTKADVGLPNVPDNIAQVMQEAETSINLSLGLLSTDVGLLTTDVGEMKTERQNRLVDLPRLLPTFAFATVPYGVDTQMTFTARVNGVEGEGIVIEFINPEVEDNPLTVEVIEGQIVVTHDTDETGAISTLAGTLETEINNNVDASALVLAAMGQAGTVDFVGQVTTANFVLGRVCKAGDFFSDGSDLYFVLQDCDGENNELAFFRKVALQVIGVIE